MRILVSFSGGKDSQACLIWASHIYGAENIEAIYMDTGWENPITYDHIQKITGQLNVKLTILQSKKYSSLIDLAKQKKRFPSTKAKFCSVELKVIPFINFILDHVQNHFFTIEGIRSQESTRRSLMESQCTYFKYYFHPYESNPMIVNRFINRKNLTIKDQKKLIKAKERLAIGKNDEKFYTYRKKKIIEFCKMYSDDLLRPVFTWTSDQVIQYILENDQQPNPLYKMGFSRVGCFPCIMANHGELKQIILRFPDKIDEMKIYEREIGSFFKPGYIPERFQTGMSEKGKSFPTMGDIEKYLLENNATGDLFETGAHSCASVYGLCE